MPRLNGIDAARQLIQGGTCATIIFLTVHEDVAYATTALDEGVAAYVLKHSAAAELLTAIREALKGNVYVSPAIASDVFRARRRRGPEAHHELSAQHREILRLLANGLTAKLALSRKTVEYHKYHIMERLQLKTTADLIRYAIKHGIATV